MGELSEASHPSTGEAHALEQTMARKSKGSNLDKKTLRRIHCKDIRQTSIINWYMCCRSIPTSKIQPNKTLQIRISNKNAVAKSNQYPSLRKLESDFIK